MTQKYIVTKDVDMIAPKWLSVRINEGSIKIIRKIIDEAEVLEGVKIGYDMEKVGDTICFNGKRIYIERRCSRISHRRGMTGKVKE